MEKSVFLLLSTIYNYYCLLSGISNTWSEPKPFTVSVSVRSGGCDEYPDEGSDERCEYIFIGALMISILYTVQE